MSSFKRQTTGYSEDSHENSAATAGAFTPTFSKQMHLAVLEKNYTL
jgi:hypothetical protein